MDAEYTARNKQKQCHIVFMVSCIKFLELDWQRSVT